MKRVPSLNEPIELIVGLGNPGNEYVDTRHNAGFWFLESVARAFQGTLSADKKFFGLAGKVTIDQKVVHLLQPLTFMNLSGQGVAALCQFYKISPANMLVAHDELDLEPGTARLKFGGGHGGHNGLRDIIQRQSNNRDFHRLRLGIGHPGDSRKVTGYVLGNPPSKERDRIDAAIAESLHFLPQVIAGGHQKVMNQLHQFAAP